MKKIIKIVGIVLIVLAIIIFNFFEKEELEEYTDYDKTIEFIEENYVIEIKGEVNRPGIYIIRKDARISDAIELALGFTSNANIDNINLATKITDGMLIYIYKKEEIVVRKVSINYATLEELKEVPNMTQTIAKSIISYREQYGMFKSIEEIKKCGVDSEKYELLKDYLCL